MQEGIAPDRTDRARAPSRTSWYLVKLKQGAPDRARTNLERQGIEVFGPERLRTERRRGKLETRSRPLFPGYLFIRSRGSALNWQSVNGTYGVARVVCMEPGRPSVVPDAVIAALREGAAGTPACGDRVRVVVGPFADLVARVEATAERDRILVLLDIMGRRVRARVGGCDVQRL